MTIVIIEDGNEPSHTNFSKKVHIIDYHGYADHIPIRLGSLGFNLDKIKYYKAESLNINLTERYNNHEE